MSDFRPCPVCKEYGWLNEPSVWLRHTCKPQWECRGAWTDEDNWSRVHATDAEQAAERYCERYDQNDGCYPIVSGGMRDDVIVFVRKDEDAPEERFEIEAEMVPNYRASKSFS